MSGGVGRNCQRACLQTSLSVYSQRPRGKPAPGGFCSGPQVPNIFLVLTPAQVELPAAFSLPACLLSPHESRVGVIPCHFLCRGPWCPNSLSSFVVLLLLKVEIARLPSGFLRGLKEKFCGPLARCLGLNRCQSQPCGTNNGHVFQLLFCILSLSSLLGLRGLLDRMRRHMTCEPRDPGITPWIRLIPR